MELHLILLELLIEHLILMLLHSRQNYDYIQFLFLITLISQMIKWRITNRKPQSDRIPPNIAMNYRYSWLTFSNTRWRSPNIREVTHNKPNETQSIINSSPFIPACFETFITICFSWTITSRNFKIINYSKYRKSKQLTKCIWLILCLYSTIVLSSNCLFCL